jgi:hypothetical protein
MIESINRSKTKIVRIHASGDFDNVTYIKRWQRIVRDCPETVFYFYTRSWVISELLPHLKKLAQQPNVYGWLSCDRTMPVPPKFKGIRRCYMSIDDWDEPWFKVDLVFRVRNNTPKKRVGAHNNLVCPVEQGVERKVKITCEKCGICFSNYSTGKQIHQIKKPEAAA